MLTGDSSYIKKINRGLILQKVIEHEFISRADLSKITGLNKATISVQVNDLLNEGLLCETLQEHHVVGRRPIMLSINENAGYVLGIDLDYKKIIYSISNFKGVPVQVDEMIIDTEDYDTIIKGMINNIKEYQACYSEQIFGIVNIVIGVHGTVNKDTESIRFFPTYNWHNKTIRTDIQEEVTIPIFIENNANLSAYAEKVYNHHHSKNLHTIILTSGIGVGMIDDGKLQKGFHGYAGEIGHMIIYPKGELCRCGNHGCWELYASEPYLIQKLSKQLNQSISIQDIKKQIEANDENIMMVMEQFIQYLAIGLNNIINLNNPETIVINSQLLKAIPQSIEKIKNQLTSSVSEYSELVLSDLGSHSSVLGACALGIKHFFEVPEVILPIPSEQVTTML